MRKYIGTIGIVLAALLFLAGCEGNIFMERGWGQPETPAKTVNADDPEAADSYTKSVYEWLSGGTSISEADKDNVVENLREIASNPAADKETKQKAATYAAQIELKSNPEATKTVNSMFSTMMGLMDGDDQNGDDADDDMFDSIIKNIFPAEVTADEATFKKTIESLQNAAESYDLLAQSIEEGDTLDYLTAGEKGDLVQQALVCLLVDFTAQHLKIEDDDGTVLEGADALFKLITADEIDENKLKFEDADGQEADFDEFIGEESTLMKLLEAAGGDFFTDIFNGNDDNGDKQ